MRARRTGQRPHHHPNSLPCTAKGCPRRFRGHSGRTKHVRSAHCEQMPPQVRGHTPSHDDITVLDDPIFDIFDYYMDENEGIRQSTPLPCHSPDGSTTSESSSSPPPENIYPNSWWYHPFLDGKNPSFISRCSLPCDEDGNYLPLDDAGHFPPPARLPACLADDWTPYRGRIEFETMEFLFCKNQMSAGNMDILLDLWAATLLPHSDSPPFAGHSNLYETIDSTPLGGVKWQNFSISYQGKLPDGVAHEWMTTAYEVWYRDPHLLVKDMLANPDYKDRVDYAPLQEFDAACHRQYHNFMSGDWAWRQADILAEDPETHGATFVPIILGSDKTTVSVATGHNEYYPLYVSIGNVHNCIRRAHRNAVSLVGFLAIPKTGRVHSGHPSFRKFRRQLFHTSLSIILQNLKPGMTVPEVVMCSDGHFRKVVYGLGPYIADYPEQVLLTCIMQGWCPRCTAKLTRQDQGGGRRSREHTELIVRLLEPGEVWVGYGFMSDVIPFTNDFPRADIHELIAPDILHQVIKGVFKDHLVDWIEKYLVLQHGASGARLVLDDIDRRIAAAPPFSGLRRFPQGRGFKQWTGDDSKALMKVYLPAIDGHVPCNILRALRAFLEFCYIVRHNTINEPTLWELKDALDRFNHFRTAFEDLGVRPDGFALPRQHSLFHYFALIRAFGAPNGLCSSITESKHIKAVKQPWRRSNRYKALSQMLLTNQRLDKLAAAHVDFTNRGMLDGTVLSSTLEMIENLRNDSLPDAVDNSEDGNNDAVDNSEDGNNDDIDDGPSVLARVELARTVLYPQSRLSSSDVALSACPAFSGLISIVPSATISFYAPSDPSRIDGMRRGPARHDCVLVNSRPNLDGMRGLDVARILAFFSFTHLNKVYPCALVHWYTVIGDACNENTGMWMVKPDMDNNAPVISIIHVDTIFRGTSSSNIQSELYFP
ncbi:hypothetical protein BGW80DRAFT_1439280 [Lactifluus volemus]|nr:hypothetical protein BGW80DRAFT_1439280 [Lactifluus volemus]